MEELIFTDRAISQEMKMSNYEQFISLVRMHLSFELDLNTDEFDLPCHEVIYYEKGKVKKWNRLSKKIKGCTTGTRTCSPPEENALCLTPNLIDQLRVLKDFLMRSENIIQEGIFRRTGAVSRQNELRSIMIQRKEFNVVEGYTVHDCAAVFKGCLSELAEPLLTDAHYPAHCQIAELCNAGVKLNSKIKEDHLLHSVQLILLLLPEENRILLEDVINMLHETAKHQTLNKMSPDSLATLFTPHLICPRNLPAEALHYVSQSMSSVISYMIVKGQQIFDIPPKLATDIRAYSLEQTRKKAMSPEQILDLSISDISTVNTVYTFVDREKTAEAHNSNPTDTALAQLYAHIQSLPESSKKRKLIKQFNRENGQGTPLQFLMLNRLKNAGSTRSAKSIGNSIKKHIFQRSIMSRTPKKNIPLTQCDTPNTSITAPKVRVLFQSPNQNSGSFGSSLACKRHPSHKSVSSSSLLTATAASALPRWEVKSFPSILGTDRQLRLAKCYDFPEENTGNDENTRESLKLHESFSSNDCFAGNQNPLERRFQHYGKVKLTKKRKLFFNRKSESDAELIESSNQNNLATCEYFGIRKSVSLNNFHSACSQKLITNEHCLNQTSCITDSNTNSELTSDGNDKNTFTDIEITPRGVCTYRSKEVITSTPSLLFGRRSMSPITKSTQRMPKSMQESIMTPRSRKPVMLANTLGFSESNHPSYDGNLSSFREQDEDSFLNHNLSTQVQASIRSYGEDLLNNEVSGSKESKSERPSTAFSLTNTFREYLLGRSVLTASPVDTSFSSHSDDFGSTPDIRDLNGSEMSSSLLHCLDGNKLDTSLSDSSISNELMTNSLKVKYRKRRNAKSKEIFDEKENDHPNDISHFQPKKVLILETNSNETSL